MNIRRHISNYFRFVITKGSYSTKCPTKESQVHQLDKEVCACNINLRDYRRESPSLRQCLKNKITLKGKRREKRNEGHIHHDRQLL